MNMRQIQAFSKLATRYGGWSRAVTGALPEAGESHLQPHTCSFAHRALDRQLSAYRFCAGLHIAQSMLPPWLGWRSRIKAVPIVMDQDLKRILAGFRLYSNLPGSRMFQGVGQRLFHDKKDVMPYLGRQRSRGQVLR